jgi:hypothetical protein
VEKWEWQFLLMHFGLKIGGGGIWWKRKRGKNKRREKPLKSVVDRKTEKRETEKARNKQKGVCLSALKLRGHFLFVAMTIILNLIAFNSQILNK